MLKACCVPPSVYMGLRFRLRIRASEESCKTCILDVLRARKSVVSWANWSVGVSSCSDSPNSAAPPCAVLPILARGMSGFWIRQIAIFGESTLQRPVPSRLAPPGRSATSCPAECRPAKTRKWYIQDFSRTRLASQGFAKTNKRRYTGQQPGTKSDRVPRINRGWFESQTRVLFLHRFTYGRFP